MRKEKVIKAINIKPTHDVMHSKIWEYIAVAAVLIYVFILSMKLEIKDNEAKTAVVMINALAGVGVYGVYLYVHKQLTTAKIIRCIIICGVIMRAGYMIYTHMFTRAHDLGAFEASGNGNLAYIINLADNNSLPINNENQFYHPPFFHWIASLFVKLGKLFYKEDYSRAFEFSQIPNCIVSCWVLIVIKNFIKELNIKDKYQICALAVVAFFPNFFLMAGRLNNDMFAAFFSLLCVFNTYKWYKKRDLQTMVFLALSFGLGMMSKISCGTIAIFTGPIMLYCLFTEIRRKNKTEIKNMIIQFCVFALICFPLALWYPIRNYVLFHQPFNYVPYLGKGHFTYTGDKPLYKRLFEVSVPNLFNQPLADVSNDYSLPMHIIRTSVFGEFAHEKALWIIRFLLITNLILIIVSVISAIFTIIKSTKNKSILGLACVWAIQLVSYIIFNINYPFICTADFRYIPLVTVIGAIFTGYGIQLAGNSGKKYVNAFGIAAAVSIVCFCAASILMYI